MFVVIKGAGDRASGVAVRLYRAGISITMTDLPFPTATRHTVSFCPAIVNGEAYVEGIRGVRVNNAEEAFAAMERGEIAVLADPEANIIKEMQPPVVVDAILAKYNVNTKITDAPVVIAMGPGFTAGEDCHAVIETMRGHSLGRVILDGAAMPNTGSPGVICGCSDERILRAPANGVFTACRKIGDLVKKGEVMGMVGDAPMLAKIDGVLRGILTDGCEVFEGMKSGDIDPRGVVDHCYTVSDKARAIGGGVLEAILMLGGFLK